MRGGQREGNELTVNRGPFWGALGYAAVMKGKEVKDFVDFEYTDLPSSRGQRYDSEQ